MRLFFLLLLFVFVVLSNRYGLQGVGVGVLEGKEGVWKQRQASLLALFKYQCHQIKLYNY